MEALIILRNILILLAGMIVGILLLRVWWRLVQIPKTGMDRRLLVSLRVRESLLLVLGLLALLGPLVSIYVAYRKDREDTAVRRAIVDAHNDFNRNEFVHRYNAHRMELRMAATYDRVFTRAFDRDEKPLPPRLIENRRKVHAHMDSFLVHMTTTRFRDSLQIRPGEMTEYFRDGHSLNPGGTALAETRWAHTTDTALVGIVTVERGRFAFDGYEADTAMREETGR